MATRIQMSWAHSEPPDKRVLDVDVVDIPSDSSRDVIVKKRFELIITENGIRIRAKDGTLVVRPEASNVVEVDVVPD